MVFPWKMLVGPAVLLGMKTLKFDYDRPDNLLIIRVLYGVSQIVLFSTLAYIYHRISSDGDEKKSVKVKVPSPSGSTEETNMTYKEYDMTELMKLLKSFGLGAAMTVAIHAYMAVVPALILQMVTQPVTLFDHALFSIYVLNKDSIHDPKLKRPFVDDSPAAKLEAMKEKAKERARQEELTQGDNAKVDGEDESEEAVEGDSAVTTESEPLTRAERRPRRVASAELSES